MDEDRWVWVAVRVAGLYLLVRAVLVLPNLVANIWLVLQLGTPLRHLLVPMPEEVDLFTKMLVVTQVATLKALASLVLYSAGALYFLRRGKAVARLIARTPGNSCPDKERAL